MAMDVTGVKPALVMTAEEAMEAKHLGDPELDAVLQRLHGMFGKRVQDRRMEILGLFEDHAGTNWAGPGHVTVNQFARAVDLLGFKLNRQEMFALCSMYCDTDLKNEFNYVNFCATVDPIFGRDGRCKGKSLAYEKFQKDVHGMHDKPVIKANGNPYFDAYGAIKHVTHDTLKMPLSARTPRGKEAMMLRQGFQHVASAVVSNTNSPSPVKESFPPSPTPGPGDLGDPGPSTAFDHGHLIGVNLAGVEDDLDRIRAQIFRRRIRTKEFFCKWDARSTGRITREQFSRGIASIIYPNTFYDPETPIDIEEVINSFHDFTPGVKEPQVINYLKFCDAMDTVFGKNNIEGRPATGVPKPGHCVVDAGGFQPRTVSDEPGLKALLRRIAYLVSVHGVDLGTCFNDCQRSHADVRTGRINAETFIHQFPLAKSTPTQPAFLKRPDMELLIQRYTDDNGWMRLFSFIADIEKLQEKKPSFVRPNKQLFPSKWSDYNSVNAIVGKLGL